MRYLNELNDDELRTVLDKNDKFWDLLVDYHYNDCNYWISEAFSILNEGNVIVDYSISTCSHSYIQFSEFFNYDVLENIKKYIENHGASDTIREKLKTAYKYQEFINLAYRLFYDNDILGKEYSVDKIFNEALFDEAYTKIIKDLSDDLANWLKSWYDYDDDVLLSVLENEFMVDDPTRFYIKDDSYIVYENKEVKYG